MSSRKPKPTSAATSDPAVVASLVAAAESASASPSAVPRTVTALAAEAMALTARSHAVTAEQEVQLKTRLQYRLYQRNHRAKQQRRVAELERAIAALRDEIVSLEATRQSVAGPFAMKVISAIIGVFRSREDGADDSHEITLREVLASDPRAESVVRMWRNLCGSFRKWNLETVHGSVAAVHAHGEDIVVLSSAVVLKLWATEDELFSEFPVSGQAFWVAVAARGSLDIAGRIALLVQASTGLVVTMSLDVDIVASVRVAVERPLREVERIVGSSRCLCSLHRFASKQDEQDELKLEEEEFASVTINGYHSSALSGQRWSRGRFER